MNGGCITTFTRRRIDPLAARVDDIDLADIAHALALTCRFKGHCRDFYSVAEHSVRVSHTLHTRAAGPAIEMAGLMHDAAEAYLSDLGGPIKSRFFIAAPGARPPLEPFDQAEDRLLRVIAEALRFPPIDYDTVRSADLILLATEARDLLGIDARDWGVHEPPLHDPIKPWDWRRAETTFLERFRALAAAIRSMPPHKPP
jgi:hypothetical protein